MTVILVLSFFVVFLAIDYFVKPVTTDIYVYKGTQITTPGFEMLGALAQDGGKPIEEEQRGTVTTNGRSISNS